MAAEEIRVRGTVQGVGFRPTVWRLARECGVTGEVLNDADGVLIRAYGESGAIESLATRLEREPPPLARIEAIRRSALVDGSRTAPTDFTIVASVDGKANTNVAADAATCPACLADIRDPGNRRYRYPFTNCTHCGPRLSIVESIPYDRPNTSMKVFPMCPDCEAEYRDPADRRFHAQPNACAVCGPTVWLEDNGGRRLTPEPGSDAVSAAARLIAAGRIVAVKGIGGFHLACDATNPDAVSTLRARKHRYAKALAMMAPDVDTIRRYARVSAAETALLESAPAPIVVLEAAGEALPDAIAPGQDTLGFMLPYTPLHHLLLDELEQPIVLTSGNRSDEPQVIDNEVARSRLADIADVFLMHDRDIVNRLDDSVVTVVDDATVVLRRARGYAPEPLAVPAGFEAATGVLAMGGELKNTFCLFGDGRAIVSQHMGDMEDATALLDAEQNLALYQRLYEFEPAIVAVDRHPEYLPTKTARSRFDAATGVQVVDVQHHHAHVAACLAEHGRPVNCRPVLGVVLDGLGWGDDNALWGGEFLVADYRGYERVAHFLPVALPGAAKAMRDPWRNTWAHLEAAFGWEEVVRSWGDLDGIRRIDAHPVGTLRQMLERSLNCPPASSAGRLFDAVAGLLGICPDGMRHEAEAAMALEALARPAMATERDAAYGALIDAGSPAVVRWEPLWEAVLRDLRDGVSYERIAARFHHGIADAVVSVAVAEAGRRDLATAVLSGGVFQNRLLLDAVTRRLHTAGLEVLSHGLFPANDGGLALGQAAIAATRSLADSSC
ncbi:MAG: carbamoyltransferase HypF [Woeseiaceae bacterium]|jgi:hydrogenase maturation protein HypF|nr:carbamoyltransferase HypF [Woeseiaceae bacterium]